MKRSARAGLVLAVTVSLMAGLVAASRYRASLDGNDSAMVRLSWRVRSIRVRECRKLTAQELAALPAHMRLESCEGRLAPYRLRVSIDGRVVERLLVSGSGARHDRPLYVYRELNVPRGRHSVDVEFERAVHDDDEEHSAAAPARLALRRDVDLAAGQIMLVTYDGELRALVARGIEPGEPSARSGRSRPAASARSEPSVRPEPGERSEREGRSMPSREPDGEHN